MGIFSILFTRPLSEIGITLALSPSLVSRQDSGELIIWSYMGSESFNPLPLGRLAEHHPGCGISLLENFNNLQVILSFAAV